MKISNFTEKNFEKSKQKCIEILKNRSIYGKILTITQLGVLHPKDIEKCIVQ